MAGGGREGSGQRAASLAALAMLGLGLEAVYLVLTLRASLPGHLYGRAIDIVTILGADVPGLLSYALPVLAAFAGYGGALALARRLDSPRALALVLAFALVHAVTLAFMFPALALDVFHYVADARTLWVHHQNPLTVAPAVNPDGGVYPYAAYYTQPSPYGPFWSVLTVVTRPAGLDGVVPAVLAFKGLAIVFYLGTGLLLYRLARRLTPERATFAATFFLWNPLVLLEVAGNGHNDVVMMFLVVAALALAFERMPGPAILLLFVASLVKFVPLLLVPPAVIWFLRNGDAFTRRWTLWGLACGALVVVLAYAPFWEGLSTLDTARNQATILANSPAAVLSGLLAPALSSATAGTMARWAFGGLFGVLYAGVLVWLLLRRRAPEALVVAPATAVFLYLVFGASWFQPWYLVWLLPLAALLPDRRLALSAALFSLTAALLYVPVDFIWQTYLPDAGPIWPHRMAALTVFPLPVLALLWPSRPHLRLPFPRRRQATTVPAGAGTP